MKAFNFPLALAGTGLAQYKTHTRWVPLPPLDQLHFTPAEDAANHFAENDIHISTLQGWSALPESPQ